MEKAMTPKEAALALYAAGKTGMEKVVTLPNGATLYVAGEYAQGQIRGPVTRTTFHLNSKKIGEAKLNEYLRGIA